MEDSVAYFHNAALCHLLLADSFTLDAAHSAEFEHTLVKAKKLSDAAHALLPHNQEIEIGRTIFPSLLRLKAMLKAETSTIEHVMRDIEAFSTSDVHAHRRASTVAAVPCPGTDPGAADAG